MSINSHANPDERGRWPGLGVEFARRDLLKLALVAPAWRAVVAVASPVDPPITVRAFRLVEADGLRRSSYPIHATVAGPGRASRFRLVCDGRPVEAQFRPAVRDGEKHDVALDFEATLGPFESRRYEVHHGLGVESGPEPRSGLKVERAGDAYRVAWPGGMAFAVGPDLLAPFREGGSARLSFLKPAASAISIRAGEPPAGVRPALPGRATITREGPLAVGIRVESGPIEGGRAASIDLTFARSQTWAEAVLATSDPGWDRWDPQVSLALAFDPTLGGAQSGPGWARLADPTRSVTVGAMGTGRVSVEAGGRVAIRREDGPRRDHGPKTLEFRVHLEPKAGPSGSSTGPESLIRPPRVEWDRPKPSP